MNTPQEAQSTTDTTGPGWARWVGVLGLATAVFATLMLTLAALKFFPTLPGCGPESGCNKVTSGIWGTIPGIGWPVSFVGFCYFTSMLVIWLRGNLSRYYLWIIRLGMLCSVGFVVIMISEQSFCQWCIISHIGNLVAWLSAEYLLFGSKTTAMPGGPGNHWLLSRNFGSTDQGSFGDAIGGLTFVCLTCILVVVFWVQEARDDARKSQGLLQNQLEIASGTTNEEALARLQSRNVIGPEDAAVKVVLFTDYQCPDCKKTENLLSIVMRGRDDMSLGIKHYPYNTNCNDRAKSTAHPNACWAARAAETAGIIGGPEGFEKMHNWLFEVSGSFGAAQLNEALDRMGFDREQFKGIMMSEVVLQDIKADSEDGYQLGLFYTPMMFINGVEFKWYYGGGDINNVRKTINLAAQSGQAEVIPASRNEKLFQDWKNGKNRSTPASALEAWRGDGSVEIVIFADYQHQSAKEADQIMQSMLEKEFPIKYAWRHAPFEYRGDNPWIVSDSKNLALGVEAARELGGDEARWQAHDWALAHGGAMSKDDIAVGIAGVTGLSGPKLFALMSSPKLQNKLSRDEADKKRTWRQHSPAILINGRYVPRWRDPNIDPQGFLEALVRSAQEEKATPSKGIGNR